MTRLTFSASEKTTGIFFKSEATRRRRPRIGFGLSIKTRRRRHARARLPRAPARARAAPRAPSRASRAMQRLRRVLLRERPRLQGWQRRGALWRQAESVGLHRTRRRRRRGGRGEGARGSEPDPGARAEREAARQLAARVEPSGVQQQPVPTSLRQVFHKKLADPLGERTGELHRARADDCVRQGAHRGGVGRTHGGEHLHH